jgi:branched-chain amino acid transport system ATP-binding protein
LTSDTLGLLEVQNLTKAFGGVLAVSDVSFTVPVGRATSLVGPNGAGKTTIFNLITGALKADSGRVFFEGRDISGLAPSQVARLGISRTFQDLRIFLGMTVLDNVLASFQGQLGERPWAVFVAPGRVLRQERELRARALDIVARVGLKGREDDLAGNLSFSEQKLIIIARSIAMEAPLWLLDEPAAGLDTRAVTRMMDQIRGLVSEGQTVLIVEHNMRVVRDISDWILFLSNGKLIAQGTPDQILSNVELRQLYLGEMRNDGLPAAN